MFIFFLFIVLILFFVITKTLILWKAGDRSSTKDEGEDSWDCRVSHYFSCSSGVFIFSIWFSVSHPLTVYCSFNLWFCFNWKTCVKHCSQAERDGVFEELRPHFLTLAYNAYAVHLVKKMLDNGNGLPYLKYIYIYIYPLFLFL